MISDFAGDYISLGDDIQEMQHYINTLRSVLGMCVLGILRAWINEIESDQSSHI